MPFAVDCAVTHYCFDSGNSIEAVCVEQQWVLCVGVVAKCCSMYSGYT